jgi:phage terminase Nu1 subunit (DNA packaging protein)
MEIARERFLDDSRLYHVTLTLRSRTTEAHSLLTALSSDEREAVGRALAKALDEISAVVARRLPRQSGSPAVERRA